MGSFSYVEWACIILLVFLGVDLWRSKRALARMEEQARVPDHKKIRKVAEALADQLFNDWEELATFVEDSLTDQYDGPDGCIYFLEDWACYVEKDEVDEE